DEGHGERESLFLAAGQLAVKCVALFFQTESFEKLFRIAAAFVKAREKTQSLHHAKFIRKGSRLQSRADFVFQCLRLALRVKSADRDASTIQVAEAFENFHGRSF